jgi:hypothetical protein
MERREMGFSNGHRSAFNGDEERSPFCPANATVQARELLRGHPHFCGRVDAFEFERNEDVLVVKGYVPTYYLKQLLQNALKDLRDVRIDNRVEVIRPER